MNSCVRIGQFEAVDPLLVRVMIRRLVSGVVCCLLFGTLVVRAEAQARDDGHVTLAVTNVDVIDVEAGKVLRDQSVLVAGRKITYVGRLDEPEMARDARIIDGNGLYLVPGFRDMHAHLAYEHADTLSGPAMVANGVMYARDMSGDCIGEECDWQKDITEMRTLQARIEAGDILGPRLVGISSYAVEGPNVAYNDAGRPRSPSFLAPVTADQGRSLVRYMVGRGVDLIKSYDSIPRQAYIGLMSEAHRLQLAVGGHVPKSVLLIEAIRAGQRTIDHAKMLPLACSAAEEKFRNDYASWLETDIRRTMSARHDGVRAPAVAMWRYYEEVLGSFDEEKCDRYLEAWAASGAYYVPTHVTRLVEAIVHLRPFANDPRSAYVSPDAIEDDWEAEADAYSTRFAADPDLQQDYLRFHELAVELTGRAYQAGVDILVGTDVGDTLVYPGFSFHDEMRLMADAGMPPGAVLRSATSAAARFYGPGSVEGTISAGAAADFILLRANPLVDIANTESIEAIHYLGKFYDRDALDAVLAGVAAAAKGSPEPREQSE